MYLKLMKEDTATKKDDENYHFHLKSLSSFASHCLVIPVGRHRAPLLQPLQKKSQRVEKMRVEGGLSISMLLKM